MRVVENRFIAGIILTAVILAFIVVILGAYTRLKDAGLGCPDWPGCYGSLVVPHTTEHLAQAKVAFPAQEIHQAKAWTEMVHRYFAGTMALLVFFAAGYICFNKKLTNRPWGLAFILIAIIVFQALLGMWTVTLRLLPSVVMLHLLGGMTLLSLLWLLTLRIKGIYENCFFPQAKKFKPWAIIGLVIVFIQIFLGGWTSSNYAAFACPDFPFCQGKLWPSVSLHAAFQFWLPIGPNYQGGLLDDLARVSIHMLHRLGAVITFIYGVGLALGLIVASNLNALKTLGKIILGLLVIQILLGISNVIWWLPLPLAVAHNGVAALLLLSFVTLNYALYVMSKNDLKQHIGFTA